MLIFTEENVPLEKLEKGRNQLIYQINSQIYRKLKAISSNHLKIKCQIGVY